MSSGRRGYNRIVVRFTTTLQSVHITTKVLSSPGTPVPSTKKTDIAEILLKVVLSTITLSLCLIN